MKKFYKILQKILFVICAIIIVWFLVYFLRGEEFSLTFSDRVFASWFPQILVFTTGVSVYLLFILQVKSKFQWWKKLLILLLGFVFATIPFLLYHGYFQYQQCSFWNTELKSKKELYFNKVNEYETVKILEKKCDGKIQSDTVYSKKILTYFELIHSVKIEKAEKANWTTSK
ncbi:MAG TPA: hypothetical protein VKY36_06255 [Moheibacter sp.]|nr:hypothetical protein [Moheibacter sp.]